MPPAPDSPAMFGPTGIAGADAPLNMPSERFPPRGYGSQGFRGASPDGTPARAGESAPGGDKVGDPDKFVFILFVIFGFPVIDCILTTMDGVLTYWIGSFCLLACLVPAVLAAGYFGLMFLGVRRKATIVCMSLLPAAALLGLGQGVLYNAKLVSAELRVEDCGAHFPAKWALEEAHKAASQLLSDCVQNQTEVHQVPQDEALAVSRVHRCPGYDRLLDRYSRELPYLQLLEEQKSCAGWCTASQPMWASSLPGEVWDSCAMAVGEMIDRVVIRTVRQVNTFCMLLLALFSIALVGGGPQMPTKLAQADGSWP